MSDARLCAECGLTRGAHHGAQGGGGMSCGRFRAAPPGTGDARLCSHASCDKQACHPKAAYCHDCIVGAGASNGRCICGASYAELYAAFHAAPAARFAPVVRHG